MKKSALLFIVFITTLSSCNNVNDEKITGLYVSQNNVNTIDTLWIFDDNTYINKMYRKSDSSLVFNNKDKYLYKKNYIIFRKFFSDEDEEHSTKFTEYNDVLVTTKLPIEKKDGTFIIHHKPMYEHIYLLKVRDVEK